MTQLEGRVLKTRFRIDDEIGAGGMGTVYRGIDKQTTHPIAVKMLRSDVVKSAPDIIERFRREGEALRELNHPNIVKILEMIEDSGEYFLIMEYIRGGDLKGLLDEHQTLDTQRTINMAIDLADALTRAHRLDIIHRDLKPANVLIADDDTVRLTDFGIAHLGRKERVTQTDAIVGTLDYIAPEVLGGEDFDARADIWSFGIMLFEMVSGKRPFEGETIFGLMQAITTSPLPDLEELAPDVPVQLLDLIYRMLERDPNQRIPSVRLVGAELEAMLSGRDTGVRYDRFATPVSTHSKQARNNLPADTTPFVGRESELSELAKLLNDPKMRLVTVLAPGGMGKTRLAIEAARRNLDQFEGGVFFVDLTPVTDNSHVMKATAEALKLQGDGRSPRQQVLDYLENRKTLLVMDNWEQIVDGASIVSEIMQHAPEVQILATSRVRLGQMGESLFHLTGMEFPRWETPEDALEYAAVKLFLNSAQRAQPGFELTSDNLDHVARICRLVQGMPLGIILAAAWLSMLTPEEIAAELQQGIDILADELGELPERQQSIRLVMQYSWDSMTEAEQTVFMKLSLFHNGFTREGAQAVTGANLRALMGLVNKSLIRRDKENGRYYMHELLRQFAEVQLAQSGQQDEARDAHARYFTEFARLRFDDLSGGPRQLIVAGELALESDNVLDAWYRLCEVGDAETARALLDATWVYFSVFHGDIDEKFVTQGLHAFSGMKSETEKYLTQKLKIIHANQHIYTGKAPEGERIAREVIAFTESFPDLNVRMFAYGALGTALGAQGRFDEGIVAKDMQAEIAEKLNHTGYLINALNDKSVFLGSSGNRDNDAMLALGERALALAHQIQDQNQIAVLTSNNNALKVANGLWDEAEVAITGTIAYLRQTQASDFGLMWNCWWAGFLAYLRCDFEGATAYARESIALAGETNHRLTLSAANRVLALVAGAQGQYEEAAELATQSVNYAEKFANWAYIQLAKQRVDFNAAYQNPENVDLERIATSISNGIASETSAYAMEAVIVLALVNEQRGHHERAAQLLGAVQGHPRCPLIYREQYKAIEALQKRLQAALGTDYQTFWEQGKDADMQTLVIQNETLISFLERYMPYRFRVFVVNDDNAK